MVPVAIGTFHEDVIGMVRPDGRKEQQVVVAPDVAGKYQRFAFGNDLNAARADNMPGVAEGHSRTTCLKRLRGFHRFQVRRYPMGILDRIERPGGLVL